MKTIKSLILGVCVILTVLLTACSDTAESRLFQGPRVVAVKVNDVLYTTTNVDNVATAVLPAGTDLSNIKVEVLATNAKIEGLQNKTQMDCRKPLTITLSGDDGSVKDWTLKIQSPPKISSFIIEGMTVSSSDVHFGTSSLIVQVPKGTSLTALKVTMAFTNGTLQDFTNGAAVDYTSSRTIHILGVDGTTVYTYQFIITTETVGPAVVKSMTVNGIATDSVVLTDATKNVITPYVKGLTNFSAADVALTVGFGNQIDASFTGAALNLLNGTATVKVTGTDGIQKTFTIGVPKLSLTPVASVTSAAFGFSADAGSSLALSGNYFVVANHVSNTSVSVGPLCYSLTGVAQGALSKTGTNIDGGAVTGIRKLATDDNGEILGVQLGAGASTSTTLNIYRWSSVSATPTVFVSYTGTSLGLTYGPRAAGINISGSLSGNAVITVTMAQKQDVLVWTVVNGVLTSTTPQKYTFPYAAMGYYYSIQPIGSVITAGFVGAGTGTNINGVINLTNTMTEVSKQTGIVATDCDVYTYKGRTYLAYTAFIAGSGARFRVCDITDGSATSFQNPIMDALMPASSVANGNNTVDADLSVINGKLYASFFSTNIGARIYKLEQ